MPDAIQRRERHSPRDRRNIICRYCGREWRKMSKLIRCPYCKKEVRNGKRD